MHEVKIYLDEMEFLTLSELAERNQRSLRSQAKFMVVGTRPSPKPKRFVAGQVYNDKTGQFENIE